MVHENSHSREYGCSELKSQEKAEGVHRIECGQQHECLVGLTNVV